MGGSERNKPCPCGSGRKYKRCCRQKDEAQEPYAGSLPANDRFWERVDMLMLESLGESCPEALEQAYEYEDVVPSTDPDYEMFWHHLLIWDAPRGKGRAAAHVLKTRAADLHPRQQRYAQAQLDAWLSLWRVESVTPGVGMQVVDLLTGEQRTVREVMGTTNLKEGVGLLARMVRDITSWGMHGLYPRIIPAHLLEQVVDEFRWHLALGEGPVDPKRLMGEPAFQLAEMVHAAVQGVLDVLPEVLDVEGKPLRFVKDVYEFPAQQRAALLRALKPLVAEGPVVGGAGDAGEHHLLLAPDGESLQASLEVRASELRVSAVTIPRADEVRRTLEALGGVAVTHVSRASHTMEDVMRDPALQAAAGRPEVTPEEAAAVRGAKESYYRRWAGESIPALSGLTPREAATRPTSGAHRQLLVILADIERTESRDEPASRIDVAWLRRELGLSTD